MQPAEIRQLMSETVKNARENIGKFSLFHFTKFAGKYELKTIIEQANQFAQMFNVSHQNYETIYNHSPESKAKERANLLIEF